MHTYILEYYSATKKVNFSFTTIWKALEGIVLSEINQRKINTV